MVNRPVKRRHPGPSPKRRAKRVLTQEQKEVLTARLRNAGYAGGNMEVVKAARATRRAQYDAIRERLTTCDIIEFTTDFLKLSLDGYPFLELILRCSEGLPLRDGTLTTFVEVPSDGFAVKEAELSWPQYFALCTGGSCDTTGPRPIVTGGKKYAPGPSRPPVVGARAGRRSAKSTSAAVKALYDATRAKWRKYLRPSEVMVVPIIATSQDQAEDIITQRCHELLKDAQLDWLIGGMDPKLHLNIATNDTIPLIVGAEIQAFPCNSKKVRGEAAPLVEFDEYPHFAFEGRKKDKDVRAAACGAQGQFPGCQFLMIGTPAAEQGDFYDTELAASDPGSGIMFLHASSWTAAPTLYRNNPGYYHEKFRQDPDSFTREYRARYDKSVEPMYREEDILACMVLAGELGYNPEWRWGAGIDQSGLSGNDRFALTISYYDPSRDCCGMGCRRTWSVSDLDLIMGECRAIMHRYRLYEAMTDRFAQGYVASALAKEGIQSVVAPQDAELHIAFRRLLVARKYELPMDNPIRDGLLQTQCFYTSKTNRPSIAHPRTRHGHGDEIQSLVRSAHQAVNANYMRRADDERDSADRARIEREESAYDPLTFWRQE